MIIRFGLMVAAILAIPVPLRAQETPDITDDVLACREIDRDKKRLECFDDVLDRNFGPDPRLEDRREAQFGLPQQDSGRDSEELRATIAEVQIDQKFGTIILALDNGQVWQATSAGNLRSGFKVGREVTISKGRFGGFRLQIDGRKGFRGVKRLR